MENIRQISLNGIVFNVEEDGYIVLKKYIDNLGKYYADKEDGKEIVEDIQIRFSELLLEKRTFENKAITLADIEGIIAIMGSPENFEAETDNKQESHKTESSKKRKRLYRDKESARIAGVCSGLSHYTGVDALLFRLLFVILGIFSIGFWMLAYIILWFIIPAAETAMQRYEMKGEALNIEDIEQRVKKEASEAGEKVKNFVNNNSDTVKKTANEISSAGKSIFSVLGKLFGLCFVFAAICGIGGVLAVWFVPISSVFSQGYDSSIFSVEHVFTIFGLNTTASILCLLCVIIPLILLLFLGMAMLFSKMRRPLFISIFIIFVFWTILSIFVGIGVASYVGERQTSWTIETYEEQIPINSPKIIIKSSVDNSLKNEGKFLFGRILISSNGTSKQMYGVTNLSQDIIYTNDSNVVVRIKKESSTHEHASQIDFPIEVKDSIIYLPSLFPLKNNYWGGEKVRVQLLIPRGTHVVIDKSFTIARDWEINYIEAKGLGLID